MTITRILVVEDNPDLRIEIVDYLRFCHYKASGVGSIRELHQELRYEPWDILLLDLMLPDGDGLTAASELRKTYGLQLGIIMVTARGHVEDRIKGISAGADAYLIKPINLQELKVTIEHLRLRLSELKKTVLQLHTQWQLDLQSLELICPDTKRVKLTVTELLLLKVLLEEPGKSISRDTLCNCLPPGSGPRDTRRLDSILSRLRSKAKKEAGINLPLHTLRNQGYTFAGNRDIDD